jgi:DNA-3-methyladenine glycosylase II
VYSFEAAGQLSRVVPLSGIPCLVTIDTAQSPGRLLVRATGTGFPPGIDLAAELARLVRFLWGLDDDLEGFSAALKGDEVLGPLISRFGGLRLPRAASLYECLLVAVLGQQVSVSAAQAIRRRMIECSGASVDAGGVLRRGYPSPDQLLGAGEDGLRQAGVSRPKCRYLREIAARALQGDLDGARFESLDDEQAKSLLMEIPGVGRWTAEIALMRGLGRMDVFPAGDLGLARAVRERASLATTPDEAAIRALAERWRPYRSYAAFYLWMSLAKGAL